MTKPVRNLKRTNAIFRTDKETEKMLNALAIKFDRDRSWVIRFLIKQEFEKGGAK